MKAHGVSIVGLLVVIAVAALDFAIIAPTPPGERTAAEIIGIGLLVMQAPLILLWLTFGRGRRSIDRKKVESNDAEEPCRVTRVDELERPA